MNPVKLFISYAAEDKTFSENLLTQLKSHFGKEQVVYWHKELIPPSDTLNVVVRNKIAESDLFIMVLSPDYLSNEHYKYISSQVLGLRNKSTLEILPIHYKKGKFHDPFLAQINASLSTEEPFVDIEPKKDAWQQIIKDIERRVKSIENFKIKGPKQSNSKKKWLSFASMLLIIGSIVALLFNPSILESIKKAIPGALNSHASNASMLSGFDEWKTIKSSKYLKPYFNFIDKYPDVSYSDTARYTVVENVYPITTEKIVLDSFNTYLSKKKDVKLRNHLEKRIQLIEANITYTDTGVDVNVVKGEAPFSFTVQKENQVLFETTIDEPGHYTFYSYEFVDGEGDYALILSDRFNYQLEENYTEQVAVIESIEETPVEPEPVDVVVAKTPEPIAPAPKRINKKKKKKAKVVKVSEPLPPAPTKFIDSRNGETYRTIVIANKRWMLEDVRYYIEGGSYCYKDSSDCNKIGFLYNNTAAKKACPAGWHLPNKDDWENLALALGGVYDWTNRKMTGDPKAAYLKAMETMEFTLQGAYDPHQEFLNDQHYGYYWSGNAAEHGKAAYFGINHREQAIFQGFYKQDAGFSCRCVED